MVLENAKPPTEEGIGYRIKALIVGPSKTGKTTSCMSMPGKKLLVDVDIRGQAAVGFADVDILHVRTNPKDLRRGWRDLEKVVDELWEAVNTDSLSYTTIIFDGLSSMKRVCMDFCLTLSGSGAGNLATSPGGGPSQAHYGPHIHLTDKLINKVLPLPVNIIFTGHFYNFEDDSTNKMEWFPNVFGRGLRNEIGSWFDETYMTYRHKGEYFWQTAPDRKFNFLGSTLNHLGKYWEDPVPINFNHEPAGFEYLLAKRFGKEKNAQN